MIKVGERLKDNQKIALIAILTVLAGILIFLKNFDFEGYKRALHPQKGDFVTVGKMSVPRYYHESILLEDGNVLVFGGETLRYNYEGGSDTADIYDPNTKKFTQLADKILVRSGAAITKLIDGQILISGGGGAMDGRGGKGFNGTTIYNPKTKKIVQGPNMIFPRKMHTSTLLKDARVILTGGRYNSDSEIYDPVSAKYSEAPKLNIPRFDHSAILLKDGRVLIVGGVGKGGKLTSAEIYNPKTNKFKIIGNTNIARKNVNLYLLKDGNVLISGGIKDQDKGMDSIFAREIELYNPKTDEFKIIATRNSPARMPAEVLLEDDKLAFMGGCEGVGIGLRCYASSEIFDPKTTQFIKTGDMNYYRECHRATLLKDGNVLITGNYSKGRTAELYIP